MFSLKDLAIYCGYMLLVVIFLIALITVIGLALRQNPRDWWKGFWSA